MTARWVVDIAPERDIHVRWLPISLYFKNEPPPEAKGHDRVLHTHKLMRVMESIRSTEGDDAVGPYYWELGRRIHHDRELGVTAAEALAATGLDPAHADAYDDESWDEPLRAFMDDGLSLAGDDIGTPILGFVNEDGDRVGYFGPVITRVPNRERSLRLWDGLMTMSIIPGFWELKRTRTERPEFGERPDV